VNAAVRQKTGPKPKSVGLAKTRLQVWLDTQGLTSAQLEAVTGICRQTMTRIRAGSDVRWKTMLRLLRGARLLTGEPIRMDDLFDLDPESERPFS
jgi:hypothetical protein